MLESERAFEIFEGHVRQFSKFRLRQQSFAFREFCMEKRLSNIFKTTKITKFPKSIKKGCYRVLQESPYLISSMIFEEIYFPGYILLTDQISLSRCLYFKRFWAICILQYFVKEVATPYILKLTFSF